MGLNKSFEHEKCEAITDNVARVKRQAIVRSAGIHIFSLGNLNQKSVLCPDKGQCRNRLACPLTSVHNGRGFYGDILRRKTSLWRKDDDQSADVDGNKHKDGTQASFGRCGA